MRFLDSHRFPSEPAGTLTADKMREVGTAVRYCLGLWCFSEDVKAKKVAEIEWCKNASDYNQNNGGKPWGYTLIPHDEIKENMILKGLNARFLSK